VCYHPKPAESRSTLGRDVVPVLPGSVPTFYYPVNRGISDALQEVAGQLPDEAPRPQYLYKPELVGQARVVYLARKYNISEEAVFTVRIEEMRRRGLVRWENFTADPLELRTLEDDPLPEAAFETLENFSIVDGRLISELESDFADWIYRTQTLKLRLNDALGVVAEPGISDEEFRRMCEQAAEEKQRDEVDALTRKHKASWIRWKIGWPGRKTGWRVIRISWVTGEWRRLARAWKMFWVCSPAAAAVSVLH
jgi:hypothetical protein